jgi:hypothetical protein
MARFTWQTRVTSNSPVLALSLSRVGEAARILRLEKDWPGKLLWSAGRWQLPLAIKS